MPKLSSKERDKLRTGGGGLQGLPHLDLLPDLSDLPDPLEEKPETPNPLEAVVYTDNTEADSRAELEALNAAMSQRSAAGVTAWMQDAFDSEYWVALCFQTRAQKEEFLRKAGLAHLGDKYLDGRKVAGVLGLDLAPAQCAQRPAKVDKRYANLT